MACFLLWLALIFGGLLIATGFGIFLVLGGVAALTAGLGMTALAIASRAAQGQTWGQAIGGGLADLTGVGGIYSGITNKDIATKQYLGLSSQRRAFTIGMSAVQLGATAYGAYRLGRWGVRNVRAWRTARQLIEQLPGRQAGDPTARRLVLDLQSSEAGRRALARIARLEPDYGKVILDYQNVGEGTTMGELIKWHQGSPAAPPSGRQAAVYVRNIRSVRARGLGGRLLTRRTAQTVIHEATHMAQHATGWESPSGLSEFLAYYEAAQHLGPVTPANVTAIWAHVEAVLPADAPFYKGH